MDTKELIAHAERFIPKLRQIEKVYEAGFRPGLPSITGLQAQIVDFFRRFAGPTSSFAKAAESLTTGADGYRANILVSLVEGFIDQAKSGLLKGLSPEMQGRLEAVSDLLEQADGLLNEKGIHPGAAAVLIGASLEQFLRTWAEREGLAISNRRPGLATFAQILREADLITKQDAKDIESWGGLRNYAAHGEWDQVSDIPRIRLMLEGVNLFMRRYASAG
jgi:hypothetical protein